MMEKVEVRELCGITNTSSTMADVAAGDQADGGGPSVAEPERPNQKRKLDPAISASNPKKKNIVQILGALRDYHTHNDFEESVVSGCRAGATLIREFSLSEEGNAVYDTSFNKKFFQTWNEEFRIPNGKYPANNKTYEVGNTFEIDLYAILDEPVNLFDFIREIFQADNSNVYPLWPEDADLAQITVQKDESIYLEITKPMRDVPTKLFQIERTLQLKDSCIGAVDTRTVAAAVVVNGNKHDVESAVTALRASHKQRVGNQSAFARKLDAIPMFVIYSPFRNVYSELSDIKKQFSDIIKQFSDIIKQFSDIKKQFSSFQEQLIWTSMDVDELRAECTSKGLEPPSTTVTKSALIRLLLTTLSSGGSALDLKTPSK
jgi:hypothetical protein